MQLRTARSFSGYFSHFIQRFDNIWKRKIHLEKKDIRNRQRLRWSHPSLTKMPTTPSLPSMSICYQELVILLFATFCLFLEAARRAIQVYFSWKGPIWPFWEPLSHSYKRISKFVNISTSIFCSQVETDFAFSLFELDWDVFGVHVEGAINRVPVIENTGIKSTVCGPGN